MTEAGPRIDTRRTVLSLAVALVVGFVLVVSMGRVAGFADVADTLGTAQWEWLVVCAIGQVGVFAGYAGAFKSAVAYPEGPAVSRSEAVKVVFASFGLTQLVAAGGAAGLAFSYWALRKLGFDRDSAAVRLIALNAAVYLVFGLLGFAAAALGLLMGEVPAGMAIPWLIAMPLVLLAARWFTAPTRVDRWSAATSRFGQLLGVGVQAAHWVRLALRSARGRRVPRWAGLYWAGDLLSLWAALQAFGSSISVTALAAAYTTGYLAQAIPVPFLATGGVDAATTLTLAAVGVPLETALLAVVAHRVFAFWLPIGPGLWSAVSLLRAPRRSTDPDTSLTQP